MIVVKKVGTESIAIIQHLANITWAVTYSEIIEPQQLHYMMGLIYSKTSLQKQIEKGDVFIIAYNNEKPVAFASYSAKENNPHIIKLHKIYILPNQQGKGIGKLLINYIVEDIKPCSILQLNVNRHNNALHFYQKLGFKITGEEDIDIGNGYFMNDYLMELKL